MIKFEKLRIYPPRFLLSLLLRVAAAIVAGVILMSLVYLIPAEMMEDNITKSADRLSRELPAGALYEWCTSTLANRTDSLMLLNAAYQNDEKTLLDQAMIVYRNHAGETAYDALGLQYLHGQAPEKLATYSRYWHGYLLWLKPAMCFMSYQPLRYVNGAIQNSLLLFLVFLMFRKKMTAYILPVLTAAGMLMPVLLAKSMQCSSCYYMMLFGCIAVVAMKDRIKQAEAFIFLYIGIGVAFFDFLTYPIVTIGVPATLCFAIENGPGFWDDVKRLFKICFCWCFGYGGMWAGKWIVGSLLTGTNLIANAANTAAYRLSSDNLVNHGYEVSGVDAVIYAIQTNWDAFWHTPVKYVVYITVVVLLGLYLLRVLKNSACLKALTGSAILLIIACMPFAWYCVLVNHSALHISFVNKALVVVPFALMCLCTKLVLSTNHLRKNCNAKK